MLKYQTTYQYRNIDEYISYQENRFGLGKKLDHPQYNDVQGDSELVIRAIFHNNIRPYLGHRLDYPDVAVFLIHTKLLELQREFLKYDTSYQYVREWAAKRYYNTLNDINKIRQRYWYFKPITL